MKFEITPEQQDRIDRWLKKLEPKIRAAMGESEKQLSEAFGFPYYGAIGGGITYSFTVTSLGVCLLVREAYTKEVLDLTEYSEW